MEMISTDACESFPDCLITIDVTMGKYIADFNCIESSLSLNSTALSDYNSMIFSAELTEYLLCNTPNRYCNEAAFFFKEYDSSHEFEE